MAKVTTAHVADAQGSPLSVAIEVSGHHIFGDEPDAAGGHDLGPNPYDLLTAALGECTAITVRWYALRQGWPLEHVRVEVSHEKFAPAGHPEPFDRFRKSVTIEGRDLTPEQLARLHSVAARCPVHRTLEGHVEIMTDGAEQD
jgi:putative redox protein